MTVTNLNTLTWGSKPDSDNLIRGTMRLDRTAYPDLTRVRIKNPFYVGNQGFVDPNNPTRGEYFVDPKYYWSTCKEIAQLGDGFSLVEVSGVVVLNQQRGDTVMDSYQVVYDTNAPRRGAVNWFNMDQLSALGKHQFVLEIHGPDFAGGFTQIEVPTPQSASRGDMHRATNVHVTTYHSVYAAGFLIQFWWDFQALSSQVGLTMNITNGSATPTGDLLFTKIFLRTPDELKGNGIKWSSVLEDRTIFPDLELLVSRVNADDDEHILPMRWERAFRLLVHQDSVEPDKADKSLAYSNWSAGGFYPSDIGVIPPSSSDPVSDVISDYDRESVGLANTQRAGNAIGDVPTANASQPVNSLWPARGDEYGGTSGEAGIYFFEGTRWASAKVWQGYHLHMIDQLRMRSRTLMCIYDPQTGRPIVPEDYLNGSGEIQCKVSNGDSEFNHSGGLRRDDPFGFWSLNHRGKEVNRGWTGPTSYTAWVEERSNVTCTNEAAYNPAQWGTIDWQHYIRSMRANHALAWLANDPVARLYNEMDATICRMSLWDGTAVYDPNLFSEAGTTADRPFNWGRGDAWRATAVAFAVPFSTNAVWKQAASDWCAEFYKSVLKAQPTNNAIIGSTNTGKVAKEPCYGNNSTQVRYWITQTIEVCYLTKALWEIGKVLGGTDLDDVAEGLRKFAVGMRDMAWPSQTGAQGFTKKFPTATNLPETESTGVPQAPYFTDSGDYPTTTVAGFPSSAHSCWLNQVTQEGVTAAVIGLFELARRHTTTSTAKITELATLHALADDLTEALAYYHTLGLDARTLANTPFENYAATMFALQDASAWS